ncbi:MAG: oligosaccharide flippase family protein [Paludibacter sp.]|nr:oligosaccharide flippase family protein [Paludibacter sp.]
MESVDNTAYKSIFKATSLFGGVQIYNIIIGIIKSKFIAILLGPTGMGIAGLLTSATSLVQGFTAMGLSSSAIKNIAEANSNEDDGKLSLVVTVFKRLVWFTGILGMIVTIIIAPLLSKYSFGNYDYTIPFIFLSVTLLLQQLSAGRNVLLQGMRKLNYLAKSAVIGSTIGLLVSVPIYYYMGIKGIVPTLILNAIIVFLITWWFARKIKIEKIKVSTKQTFKEGKGMLKMGIVMSLNSVLVLGSSFVLRAFILTKTIAPALTAFWTLSVSMKSSILSTLICILCPPTSSAVSSSINSPSSSFFPNNLSNILNLSNYYYALLVYILIFVCFLTTIRCSKPVFLCTLVC